MKTRTRLAMIGVLPLIIFTTSCCRKQVSTIDSNIPDQMLVETNIDICDEEDYGDSYTSLGEFRISYFCGCEICNGGYTKMASGKDFYEGAIATDSRFPFGTKLYINTDSILKEYTVEERGGAIKGNRIDIYVSDHKTCKELGIVYTDVFVKN